jgi:FkbM family methyltransferase
MAVKAWESARRSRWKWIALALAAAGAAVTLAAPGVPLRYYFWLERKLDSQAMRNLEPVMIRAGLLRPGWVRVRGGFRMELDPRDLVPLLLLRDGEWQPEVWEALAPGLPKGGVFLDVGAHIGYFSLKAAKEVGPAGRVVSFEPNPETAARLRRNVAANALTQVTVQEIAATGEEQELEFFAAPTVNTGASSLVEHNAEYSADAAPRNFRVRGRRIDNVVRELNLGRVDVMKIDVEGAELLVLRGAEETLRRHHPRIVMETVPHHLQEFGTTPEEVAKFLRGAGYTIGGPVTGAPGATDWEWTIARSEVEMGDPATARQLLKGFGGIAAKTWRWTGKEFSIALQPPGAGAVLAGKFVFPAVSLERLKEIRLTARIAGEEVGSAVFNKKGEREFRAAVPARLLRENPVRVDFSVDRTFHEAGQELGLIAYRIGLVR